MIFRLPPCSIIRLPGGIIILTSISPIISVNILKGWSYLGLPPPFRTLNCKGF